MTLINTILILFVIIFTSVHSVTNIHLNVTDINDNSTPSISVCYPTTTSLCNLRSAWEVCNQISNITTYCFIKLPFDMILLLSYGELTLNETNNIEIVGNNSTISLDTTSQSSRAFYYNRDESVDISIIPSISFDSLIIVGFGDISLSGGSIYSKGLCNWKLSHSTIKDSIGGQGGGLYLSNNTNSMLIKNCSFFENNANIEGGGIYIADSVVNIMIVDSFIDNCISSGGLGGGISIGNNNIGIVFKK